MVDAIEFEEWVDVLRRRIGAADALDQSGKLHDFGELMSDYADVTPPNWYRDALEELESFGHLHPASGAAFGGYPFARLSAEGRFYLRAETSQEADPE